MAFPETGIMGSLDFWKKSIGRPGRGGVGREDEFQGPQGEREQEGDDRKEEEEADREAVEVRAAAAHEVPRFSNLFAALLKEEGFPWDKDTVASVVAQVTLDVAAGLAQLYGAYVEEWVDDRLSRVGCVEVVTTCDPLIGWHHVVTRLYVEPAFRHRGIGMRLIRAAVADLDHPEDRLVITTRGDLPRSYRRLGAKPLILTSHATVGEVQARLRLGRKVG